MITEFPEETFGLAVRKIQNKKTLHADLILSGITLLSVRPFLHIFIIHG